MKQIKWLFILPLYFLLGCSSANKAVVEVDICIYGGTSAGVIAAYTAQQEGKSVLLIEPGAHLGGMTSGGLGYTDIGNKYVVTGLAKDFYRRIGAHYGKLEQWVFEPSVAEGVFDDYIKRAKVEVLYNSRLYDVKKEGTQITEIIVENSKLPNAESNKRIKAKVFIDCTYEGDLMAKAGASYTVGREDNSVYNETYNGVQFLDGHQFKVNIDPYIIPGDSTSGLVWGVSNNKLLPNGTGDKKMQAYNFRMCLTNDSKNLIPITRPENYDSTKFELLLRLKAAEPWKALKDLFIWKAMPNSKTDINNLGGFSTDLIGMNWNYPEASYAERAQIWKEHEDYTKGLFYFLGHDARIPENIRTEMLTWGYPKDEYTDNNNFSHQLYVREARRMVGELVMTQHHCLGEEVVNDAIAWAAYTMDSHNCDRHIVNGVVKNEGNIEIANFPPYPISYRAIVPKKNELTNLIVPVCLSASHIAFGSIRMEPVFMVLSQSAAVAAVLSVDSNVSVQEIDVAKLQKILKENPLADGSIPEIVIDNSDAEHVQISGDWQIGIDTYRSYGLNFLTNTSTNKSLQTVKYTPNIQQEGDYELYAYFPELKNASSVVTITVNDGKTSVKEQVRLHELKMEGQTKGEWVKIGQYYLGKGEKAFASISNEDADGVIVADAIMFLHVN